jgi:hypothetical protein
MRNGEQSELLFCKHHGERHLDALIAQGWNVWNFVKHLEENKLKDTHPDED